MPRQRKRTASASASYSTLPLDWEIPVRPGRGRWPQLVAKDALAADAYDKAVLIEATWRSFEEVYGVTMGEGMRADVKASADALLEALSINAAAEARADLMEARDRKGAMFRFYRSLHDAVRELRVLQGTEAGSRALDDFNDDFCGLTARKYEFIAALETIGAALPFLKAVVENKSAAPAGSGLDGRLITKQPNPTHEFIRRCAETLHVNGWEITWNSGYGDGDSAATLFTRLTWKVSRAVLDILPLQDTRPDVADQPEQERKAVQYNVPVTLNAWAGTVAKALNGRSFYHAGR